MPEWVTVALGIFTVLGSSGGVVAFVKVRGMNKRGDRQEERADEAALVMHSKDLLNTHVEVFVTPLRREVEMLREDVRQVKESLERQRERYWRLVGYTRALRIWIMTHVPDAKNPPPQPPEDVAQDL